MKFIKIMTEYEMRLSDGSFVEAANYIILTEDEFNEEILREFTEMESNDDIKVKSTKIIEMTPEEVSEAKTEEIIHHIMPGIYIESLNLPKDISIRECSKLTSGSVNHALALKQFTEKYCIYEKLTKDLDLTKVTVAELFDKIEKVYAARFSSNVSKQEFAKAIPLRYCFFCFLSLLMKVYYSFLNQYLLFTF